MVEKAWTLTCALCRALCLLLPVNLGAWTGQKNSLEGERMDVDVCLCAIGNGDISMLDTVIVVGGWSKGPFEPEPRSCYL